MPTSTTSIDRYSINYYSNTSTPTISLWKNGVNRNVASLAFLRKESALPRDYSRDGTAFLFYRLEDYPNIVDLLRNEKPVFLFWDETAYSIITSTSESVGEGEK
jgi:hypothetical protein